MAGSFFTHVRFGHLHRENVWLVFILWSTLLNVFLCVGIVGSSTLMEVYESASTSEVSLVCVFSFLWGMGTMCYSLGVQMVRVILECRNHVQSTTILPPLLFEGLKLTPLRPCFDDEHFLVKTFFCPAPAENLQRKQFFNGFLFFCVETSGTPPHRRAFASETERRCRGVCKPHPHPAPWALASMRAWLASRQSCRTN